MLIQRKPNETYSTTMISSISMIGFLSIMSYSFCGWSEREGEGGGIFQIKISVLLLLMLMLMLI